MVGILTGALALRLFLALTHDNYLGIDGGAYLLGMQQVLGQNPVAQDFTRPPLGPGWLLVPFVHVWGYDIGYKVWSAVASLAPIPVIYLLTKQLVPKRQKVAIITSIAASLSLLHAELFVTGALPLIGFGLIGLGIWLMPRLLSLSAWRAWEWLLFALLFPAVALVNMTSLGIAAIAWPIYAAGLGLFVFKSVRVNLLQNITLLPITIGPIIFMAVLGVLMSVPIIWLYYGDVMFGTGNLRHPGPTFILAPVGNWGWLVLFLGSLLGGAAVKWGAFRVKAMGLVLIAFSLLSVVWSFDEAIINVTFRGRYFAAFLAYPIVAVLLVQFKSPYPHPEIPRWLAHATSVVFLLLALGSYARAFERQTEISDFVSTETAIALQIAHDIDPDSAIIVNAFSLAWWTQALNRVNAPNTWTTTPPPKYIERYNLVRCVIGWDCQNSSEALRAAQQLGSRFVLLDISLPDRNATRLIDAPEGDPWEPATKAPWLKLTYSAGDTRLYTIVE